MKKAKNPRMFCGKINVGEKDEKRMLTRYSCECGSWRIIAHYPEEEARQGTLSKS